MSFAYSLYFLGIYQYYCFILSLIKNKIINIYPVHYLLKCLHYEMAPLS
jgi:hypothetical protein